VVEIADTAMVRRASVKDATARRAQLAPASAEPLTPLAAVETSEWQALADSAIEPNAYYLPGWELAVNASVPGRTGALALAARSDIRLIGLLPVVPMARALKIPLPALVSAHPYGTLCTPLLTRMGAPAWEPKMPRRA
jgi:hypothetical protein